MLKLTLREVIRINITLREKLEGLKNETKSTN